MTMNKLGTFETLEVRFDFSNGVWSLGGEPMGFEHALVILTEDWGYSYAVARELLRDVAGGEETGIEAITVRRLATS